MKTFACVLLLAALVAAEPPRPTPARFRLARQELAESEGKETGNAVGREAPYPASGYKPATDFKLPSRQEVPPVVYGVPANSYGAPPRTYSVPNTGYGLPEVVEGKNKKTEEVEVEEKKEKTEEKVNKEETKGKLEEAKGIKDAEAAEVINGEGAYYVLLPGSQLQRVQFQTENDVRNMAYTARLQYKNEDRAPLYVYTAVPQYQPKASYVLL